MITTPRRYSSVMFLQRAAGRDLVQIEPDAAVQHQIGVTDRIVTEQPGQFGTLVAVPGDFILDTQAVDVYQCPVGVAQLHALGIFMLITANQSPHRASSFYIFPIFAVSPLADVHGRTVKFRQYVLFQAHAFSQIQHRKAEFLPVFQCRL